MRNRKRVKGIVFSIDALLGLTIALVIFLAISAIGTQKKYVYDETILQDTLGVLEQSESLKQAVITPSNLNETLILMTWLLPDSYCSKIGIYTRQEELITESSMLCWEEQIQNIVSYRTFVVDGVPYYAMIEAFIPHKS